MPGLITHYICGEATLPLLQPPIREIIAENRALYNIGCQGPDMFFYYLPSLLRKSQRELGIIMHNGDFFKFLVHLIDGAREVKEHERAAVLSYSAGYLSHYALDCAAHPFIYYRTGARDPNAPIRTAKYSVYHRNFETALDVLMLKIFTGKKPADKKLWQLIHTTKDESRHIAGAIAAAVAGAYSVDLTQNQVMSAMRYMTRLTRVLQSRGGKRKKLIELVEGMTVRESICSSLIHLQEITDGIDYLNKEKKPWHMPWDKDTEITSDFAELFERAVQEGATMIDAMYNYSTENISERELLAITGNRSFSTGVDYEKKLKFQYHDIVYET